MAEISIVDICNYALIKIGAKPITSLADDNKAAKTCTKIYNLVRDDVLRLFPWNFAIKRVELAQLATAPVFGYSYQFELPSDCLRVLRLHDNTTVYKIENGKILTNATSVKLVYTYRASDPTVYDHQFINLLSVKLALELAYNLSNDSNLVNLLADMYTETLKGCQTVDMLEDAGIFLESNTLADSAYLNIFDNAIIRIGASGVSAASDDAKIAKMCNRMITPIRDDLLRSHPWNFAIERAALTASVTTPAFEYDYQFDFPADCLRLIKLYNTSDNYRVEGKKILTNASAINIIYIKQVTDPTEFDSNFTKCLTLKLASELALNVMTEQPAIGARIAQEFDMLFKRAKMADAQEDGIYVIQTDTLLNARYGFDYETPYLQNPD